MADAITVAVTEIVETVAVMVASSVESVAVTVAEAGSVGETGPAGNDGVQGPQGPQGEPGEMVGMPVYVQATDPGMTTPGLWLQTGLGDSGEDMTLWVEDGQ